MLVIISEYITEARIEATRRPIMHFYQLDETASKYHFPAYTHQLASVDTSLSQQISLKCIFHRAKDRTVLHPKTLSIRHRSKHTNIRHVTGTEPHYWLRNFKEYGIVLVYFGIHLIVD